MRAEVDLWVEFSCDGERWTDGPMRATETAEDCEELRKIADAYASVLSQGVALFRPLPHWLRVNMGDQSGRPLATYVHQWDEETGRFRRGRSWLICDVPDACNSWQISSMVERLATML
ncbi:hypothetical protein [Streptomyces katsurahamanus]|uniref:Uncharacterized protein n=1 Tax=Streptomyces katsurahamanus TaxID=2577098 RepID=A0ABW9P0W8_9ACTN|nr:hypothetical protein [Streptomyces katsurahamanus]MQS39210.1 hypothetical protein [Streptomyces katsurahamanus]